MPAAWIETIVWISNECVCYFGIGIFNEIVVANVSRHYWIENIKIIKYCWI